MANVSFSKAYETQIDAVHIEGYVEFRVVHGDLTAGATTEALDIPNFPARAYPLRGRLLVGAYFTGGGATTCTAQLGDSGDPNALVEALDVFSTTALGSWTLTLTQGVQAEGASTGYVYEAAYAPQILFTCSGNVSILTTGHLTGQIHYRRPVHR